MFLQINNATSPTYILDGFLTCSWSCVSNPASCPWWRTAIAPLEEECSSAQQGKSNSRNKGASAWRRCFHRSGSFSNRGGCRHWCLRWGRHCTIYQTKPVQTCQIKMSPLHSITKIELNHRKYRNSSIPNNSVTEILRYNHNIYIVC
jgi:hypothetical protein